MCLLCISPSAYVSCKLVRSKCLWGRDHHYRIPLVSQSGLDSARLTDIVQSILFASTLMSPISIVIMGYNIHSRVVTKPLMFRLSTTASGGGSRAGECRVP